MARGSGVKKLFTATRKIGSAEPVAAGETGGRHPARGAERDTPRRQIGFGSRAAAVDAHRPGQPLGEDDADRKSVEKGKSVSVRVDLGGRRIIKKKIKTRECNTRHMYAVHNKLRQRS